MREEIILSPPPPPPIFAPVPDIYHKSAEKILHQCDQLAGISNMENGVSRQYLTPEHALCNRTVKVWMQTAGMRVWQDQAGNLCGRYESSNPEAKILLIGSHLDTIPNAGKYDGILGVLLAIEAVRLIDVAGESLPFHIDVLGFGDEEGTRFGTTLLGSRAVAGTWEPEWFDGLEDQEGLTLADALREFGCDPDEIGSASRAADDLLGYFEVHIEQGPVLEQQNQPLGVVPSIAGARRFEVKISGKAGHAGTVPMNLRQDALVAAASAIHKVEEIARRFNIVATVGQLNCWPGATNVIPGECLFTIDIRSGRDMPRDLAVSTIKSQVNDQILDRKMEVEWKEIHRAPAVECASWMQRLIEESILGIDLQPVSIVSGAGHDAMSIADITDVGMMFVRCAGGVSHNPEESVNLPDVAAAMQALEKFIKNLTDKYASM